MYRKLLLLFFSLFPLLTLAQRPDLVPALPAMPGVEVADVEVLPGAVDTKGWLLLDQDIQTELEGAVHNLYNFKFDKAERQFRSLRRRYPQHPMPYFLMGLSTWWKILPTNMQAKQYDKQLYAYMDTAIVYGEKLYKADPKNYEACFFLSAAYGFDARLNAERSNWRKATVSSKRALDYLEKSKEANGLSPDFLLGQALMNYYAVWISENYPLLRPVLLFFPKGNQKLGLQQLRTVADDGFYTGMEAKFFLMKILLNEEDNPAACLPVARHLAITYPDNGYFQRIYALTCFREQQNQECERVCRDILAKINSGMPGYEGVSGKYATYMLGSLMQLRYKDVAKAKDYYERCIVFAESTGETTIGFYVFANQNLAQIAAAEKDVKTALRYYSVVRDKADRKSESYKEAIAYHKKHKNDRLDSGGSPTPRSAGPALQSRR